MTLRSCGVRWLAGLLVVGWALTVPGGSFIAPPAAHGPAKEGV